MAEIPATDAELNFIDESPPGFFPENQDSNVGIFRKLFSDLTQEAADELLTIYRERFVDTSDRYLDMWEKDLDVPTAPGVITPTIRKARVLGRLRQGPFTQQRVKDSVESYIQAVFGVPVIIGAGVPILAGITFLPASGNISALYRIYEDVLTYSYKVWIDTSTGVDTTGLTRDLTYITPSGIVFTIDQTHTGTGLIHWSNTMKHYAPSGWWGLDTTYNDSSGNAFNGTVTGAPTAIAAPGLLPGVSGTDAARDFSGAAQYVTIGDVAALNSGLFTIHSIVRPDTLPTSGNYRIIYYAGGTGNNATWLSLANYSGNVRWGFRVWNGTTFQEISGTTLPVTGTTYRVSATYDGITMKLYVNGILENSTTFVGPAALTGTKYIGVRGPADAYFWDGGLDEIAYLGYPISAADALYLSNQARNIL